MLGFPRPTDNGFSELQWGSLTLHKKPIDLMGSDHGHKYQHKVLVEFPWPASSMKKIENCIRSQPLFSSLPLATLPETDQPCTYLTGESMMQGTILESIWHSRAATSQQNHWPSTSEIQLLSALLLRNATQNNFIHVFSPSSTLKMNEKGIQIGIQNWKGQGIW